MVLFSMLKSYSTCLVSPSKLVSSILRTVYPLVVNSWIYWLPDKEMRLQPSFCQQNKLIFYIKNVICSSTALATFNYRTRQLGIRIPSYNVVWLLNKHNFYLLPTHLTRAQIEENQIRSHIRPSFCRNQLIHQTAFESPSENKKRKRNKN